MRITIKELNRNVQRVINKRYGDLAQLQQQLATGKRLLRPSDDPIDVSNTLKLQTKGKELSQFKRNIDDGLAFMGVSGTAMDSMTFLMHRMRELAIQGSTDTLSSQERTYLNKEVEQITRQLVALADTKYKGDYVFSGTQTKIAPFQLERSAASTADDYAQLKMAYFNAAGSPVGSTVQLFNGFNDLPVANIIPGSFKVEVRGVQMVENVDYQLDYLTGAITILNPALAQDVTPGTPNYAAGEFRIEFDSLARGKDIYGDTVSSWGDVLREIESGITMAINIPVDELITDPATGSNMMSVAIRLGQDLLQNNQPNIEQAIENIDSIFSAILSGQSKNGSRINRFETTMDRNEQQFNTTTELQSNLEDAEMAETVSKFMLTQNVYNAALQSAAKIIQPSLVNFL